MPNLDDHKVKLRETKAGQAVLENAERRFAEVVAHYLDVTTSLKPSKVSIEPTITPDENRQQFKIAVSGKVALSERKTYTTSLYAGLDQEGRIIATEYNPMQLRIPYEGER